MAIASKTPECTCESMHRLAREPGSPLVLKRGAFYLEYGPRSARTSVVVRHCFWCGGRTPRRAPRKHFAELTGAEQHRLETLTAGITSFGEAVTRFGPPDSDLSPGFTTTQPATADRGPVTEVFRAVVYTKLSEFADVRLVERRDGSARVTFEGKPLRKRDSGSMATRKTSTDATPKPRRKPERPA